MKKKYFGFAVADGMFPPACGVTRAPLTVDQVREMIGDCVPCLNPSHTATIAAMDIRYGLSVSIPEKAPQVSLLSGDAIIVMSVRGLPRLDNARHEYTAEEIASATFVFGMWSVT